MTDLKRFEYVLALADCMNFSQAATKLNISQSTLSQYIQKLEKEIGASLFDRSTSPMTVTQYGKIYINGARKILSLYEQTLDEISDVDSGACGSVNVGISPTRAPFILPGVVAEFKSIYPNVKLGFSENKSKDIVKDLTEGRIDFAYTAFSPKEMTNEFNAIPVCEEEVMLVCKKGRDSSKFIENGCVNLSALAQESFISLQDNQMLSDYFYSLAEKNNIQFKVDVYVSELSTAIEMVKKGLGFMILPSSYKNYDVLSRELDFYSIEKNPQKRKIVLLYKKDKYINKAMKALMDIFKNEI